MDSGYWCSDYLCCVVLCRYLFYKQDIDDFTQDGYWCSFEENFLFGMECGRLIVMVDYCVGVEVNSSHLLNFGCCFHRYNFVNDVIIRYYCTFG